MPKERIMMNGEVNEELGIRETPRGGIRVGADVFSSENVGQSFNQARMRSYQAVKPSTGSLALDNIPVYGTPINKIQVVKGGGIFGKVGGIKPPKPKINVTPVPPSGSVDTMPSQTPVSTATIVAPAPLPAMDDKKEGDEEKKLPAAPQNRTMLYLGLAAIALVGIYLIKK